MHTGQRSASCCLCRPNRTLRAAPPKLRRGRPIYVEARMLVATPEKGAPAGSREHNPQRWVSLKIATNRKIVAVPADEPLCQIIEQRVHDFQGSFLEADELGHE